MENYITQLKTLGACKEAIVWLEEGKYKSLNNGWQVCERGDWMLWLVGRLSGEPGTDKRKKLVLTACQCARLALPYVAKGESRPLKAIEITEAWANGDTSISLSDIHAAANAAADAAHATAYAANAANSAADAAAYAANSAAYAANAANSAAYAAHAAYAADAAAYAANSAAYAANAANSATLRQCADIVRQYYPVAPTLM